MLQLKKIRNSKFKPTPHEEIREDIKRRCEVFVRNRFKLSNYKEEKKEFLSKLAKTYPGYIDLASYMITAEEVKRTEPQPKVIEPKAKTSVRYRKKFEPYETDDVIDLDNIKPGFD